MPNLKDLTGQSRGMLQILERKRISDDKGRLRTYYYCHCNNCGADKWIRADSIVSQGQKTCGCLKESTQFKFIDITNRHFDRLKALEPTEKRAENGCVIWKCQCKCGNIKEISEADLTLKRVRSCGCLSSEIRSNIGKYIGKLNVDTNVIESTHIKMIRSNIIIKSNTSGYRGVTFDKSRNKFLAQIRFKNKRYYLGRFDSPEEASKSYQEAKKNLHGKFLDWYENEYKKKGNAE